ncbi:hypothetical protein Gpo141_00005977 [Globisporangium polare]
MPSGAEAQTQKAAPRSYVDVLQQESACVIAAVQTPLRELVTIYLHPDSETASLDLTLHFAQRRLGNVWRLMGRNVVDAKRISVALDAVTLLVTHSRLLKAHAKLQADFWTQLRDSKVMMTEVSHGARVSTASTGKATGRKSFGLRIVLDLGGGSRRGRLDTKWLDAIYKFMTDPQHHPELSKHYRHHSPSRNTKLAPEKIFFGLSFTDSRLTIKCLQRIQRLLESIAPAYNRHFGIDMLDLSQNAMSPEHLRVVTEILKRNHMYQIKDIRLDEIIKNPLARKASASVQDLLAAAFDVSRLSVEPQCDGDTIVCATIPIISLATNPLGAQHIASVCSALRYGCAFEELSLASMIRVVDPSEREQVWRWLAFGIFYPRSRRFAGNFRLSKINLLNSDITTEGVEAFANALYNPVAEFRRPGQQEDSQLMDAVLVGVAEKGAVVYALPNRFSSPLLTLAHQQELELLHTSQDDTWVCVVVAGVGLGWLRAEQVVSVERDLKSSTDDVRFDLVISDASRARMMTPEALTFIETIGKHLRSLAVKDSGSLCIQKIVYHCKNLTHLDLEGCNLKGESIRDLLGCLNGHFGRRIVSLNLNRTSLVDADIANLAKILKNPLKLRSLRELRLCKARITHIGLAGLRKALQENKTLAILELEEPGDDFYDEWCRAEKDRIDAAFQNEKLNTIPLPLDRRLAFLSAVEGPRALIEAPFSLEVSASKLIFDLAGESIRRKIIWTKPKPPVIE